MAEAFIVAAKRSAGARKGGRLKGWHPVDLGGALIDAVVANRDPHLIEDVIFGCVMQVGEQAVNVARNAVLASKLPQTVPGTSVDRQCGSSQQTLHFAAQAVMSGAMDVVIAGGVESMTRVPMGLSVMLPAQNNFGMYMSPHLTERFGGTPFSQFIGAEMMAEKYGLTKDELDRFAYESHVKAAAASKAGAFAEEIVPLKVTLDDGRVEEHASDEGIRFDTSLEAIKGVKLLKDGGVITAASSSQICDGAAALLIANEAGLKKLDAKPLARIHHMTVMGGDPVIMLETPIPATLRALKKTGLGISQIDLFEVNEAFASVPLAWLKETGADPARLNVRGGAIALGHPLGATGAKLMTTLVHALQQTQKRWGLLAMCEGGGMANVTVVERV